MNDVTRLKGLFLMAIALAFGIVAFHYPIGDFSRAGPGLFPLMVSALLFLIGAAIVVRSHYVAREPMAFNFRNIGLIIGSLCVFSLVSQHVNMIAGIVCMVFVAAIAGSSYSVARNLKVSIGLVLVALAFQKLLGFNLPLY
jgi:hypothetical protein